MEKAEQKNIEEAVKDILAGQKPIVWIGSGLSLPGDYPSWKGLVEDLCHVCDVNLDTLEAKGKNLLEIADCCSTADPIKYKEHLAKEFGRVIIGHNKSYEQLVSLKFHAYITTNFDPLLADAAAKDTACTVYDYPDLPILLEERGRVYYIHGLAHRNGRPSVDNLVLSQREFNKAYKSGLLIGLLTHVFTYHPILFLGYSLGEPHIYNILKAADSIQGDILARYSNYAAPERILVMSEPEPQSAPQDASSQMKKFEKRCEKVRIKVIWYKPDKHHAVLAQALDTQCGIRELKVEPNYGSGFGEALPT